MWRTDLGRVWWGCLLCTAAVAGCFRRSEQSDPDWAVQRERMVGTQLVLRGIHSERVLDALRRIPRHTFLPADARHLAYQDTALPIGQGQTISQPYLVAFMTEAIDPQPGQRVLEVGTGSGYQAAVLAELVGEVYTIELLPELAHQARERLEQLGYRNVRARAGDGYLGWPEGAPFDAVVVTCGADHVPEPLFEQLKSGGVLVIPVGSTPDLQWLRVIRKGPHGERDERKAMPVQFVPLRRAKEPVPPPG